MTEQQIKLFMKDFFEGYYKKLSEEYEGAVELPDIAEEMWADGVDPEEEWKKWKLVPSTISDEDIKNVESELGIRFPFVIKSFVTAYFHLFEEPVGRNPIDEPFYAIKNAWNPILVKAGYLPFTWDKEGCYIRCIDLINMPNEDKCVVCQIDHEILFGFDESSDVSRCDIEKNMEVIADNFIEYLKGLLD